MSEHAANLNQALLAAMDRHATQVCFRTRADGRFQDITYAQFQELALCFADYLTRQGLTKVAIAADNCLEWMVAYVGSLLSGGTLVPLRTSLTTDMLSSTLRATNTELAVLGRKEHLEADLPSIKIALAIGSDGDLSQQVTSIRAILAKGLPLADQSRDNIRLRAASITPQTMSSIQFTVTAAGTQRGAVFDQRRSLATMQHMARWLTLDRDDLAFALTPWSEFSSLAVSLHCLLSGVPTALRTSRDPVLVSVQQTSPTLMLATPGYLEQTYTSIMKDIDLAPATSRELFWWAVAKGKEYLAAGSSASSDLLDEYRRADLTFFSHIRGQMGGRMRRIYSTGGSLPQEVASFFDALGLPVLNVYSLPQAGGFPAVSRRGDQRPKACGQVSPGFEVKIAQDGEVLLRGESVMLGYWRRPEETQQALSADGWLQSKDVGHLDSEGYLYITGRKENIMVLSTGRKIVPSAIERMLTASRYILQAVVVAEGKPYISALIMPNLDALATHFERDRDGDRVTTTVHPKVAALLDEVIGKVNGQLDGWEQIREYSLLEQPLSRETGELATGSRSLRRHVIAEHYAAQIEGMYPLDIQPEEKPVTQITVDPGRLRELVENERVLQAWKEDLGIDFLFDLALDKQIDALSMVHICDTAVAVAQMASEEKPLSTALIVGDPVQIASLLPPSNFQLLQHDHIGHMRRILVTMAKIVDGRVLGYAVDRYGYVRGVCCLEVALDECASPLLGAQLGHYASISQQCSAVVFFVPPKGGQVRVFADGYLVGRYANGDWAPDDLSRVDEVVAQLAGKGYDQALVNRILCCAYQMSGENLGAIFLLGDADSILRHSDASEIRSFAAFDSVDSSELSDRELTNFAKQDGAVVIDTSGRVEGCMVQLRPKADTRAEIGPGKGARHSSAAKMSAELQCLAVTVSQDGPITVYEGGKRILYL